MNMAEFVIRINFIVVIFLCYWLGELISEKTCTTMEFKNILPAISLVFWDYYFSYLSRWLFRVRVSDKKALGTDDKIHSIKTEIKLSNNGNKNVQFRIITVQVEGCRILPNVSYKQDSNITAEGYLCSIEKNSISDTMTITCVFQDTPRPKRTYYGHNRYCFKMKIEYIINNSIDKTKRIKIIKK
jgi:hypothetical protein